MILSAILEDILTIAKNDFLKKHMIIKDLQHSKLSKKSITKLIDLLFLKIGLRIVNYLVEHHLVQKLI